MYHRVSSRRKDLCRSYTWREDDLFEVHAVATHLEQSLIKKARIAAGLNNFNLRVCFHARTNGGWWFSLVGSG
ncbi:MAG: hypothetical protein ABIO76_13670 [Ginsengibacter sp.]